MTSEELDPNQAAHQLCQGNNAASIRRLWQYSKETAKGEMERMAGGEEVHRKLTLMEAVAMENAAVTIGLSSASQRFFFAPTLLR